MTPQGMTLLGGVALLGVGVALLKEVCHWGVSFEVLEVQAKPSGSLCCLLIQL